jgi:hypothetical protein
MVTIEQQQKNVDTLYQDWLKILNLCGSGKQASAMLDTWINAAAQISIRREAENGNS